MEQTSTKTIDKHEEEITIDAAFWKDVNEKRNDIFIVFVIAALWSLFFIKFLSPVDLGSSWGVYTFTFPWFCVLLWMGVIYAKAKTRFWKEIAHKYGWEYKSTKDISNEKALLFKIGYEKRGRHGITGTHKTQPFHIFEYQYATGYGKSKTINSFTVFEVKFTGTFPHLYLNYRYDWHSNAPSFFSSLANISVPGEFGHLFKLYAPKEYEIETLEIFTPEIFAHLIDSGLDHDIEFVDGELVIYSKRHFSNFIDLDKELVKVKKLIDILSPRLNKLKLTPIGDLSPLLKR